MTYFANAREMKTNAAKLLGGPIAFAAAYAAVHAWMAPPSLHDQLVTSITQAKQALPMKLDDITTLTDEQVDGLKVTYVYQLDVPQVDAEGAAALREA